MKTEKEIKLRIKDLKREAKQYGKEYEKRWKYDPLMTAIILKKGEKIVFKLQELEWVLE